ncbi:hypothetical protein BC834DRAFT_414664 [Gloeopeniophorella convolvens]|nr:hypothetical protein BC834DRAFT_414664 [Gloeopeniophorella convolvens]
MAPLLGAESKQRFRGLSHCTDRPCKPLSSREHNFLCSAETRPATLRSNPGTPLHPAPLNSSRSASNALTPSPRSPTALPRGQTEKTNTNTSPREYKRPPRRAEYLQHQFLH